MQAIGLSTQMAGDDPSGTGDDSGPHDLWVLDDRHRGAFNPLREKEADQLHTVAWTPSPGVIGNVHEHQGAANRHLDVAIVIQGVDQLSGMLEAGDAAEKAVA